MAKAILVMDMPDRCYECDLWSYDMETNLSYCGLLLGRLDDTGSKPDWCPLINLPDDIDSEKLIKLFYKLYDEIVEDSNYGKSKQATLKLIADGIELLNIMGMNEE